MSAISFANKPAQSNVARLVTRYPLPAFLLLGFSFSWVFMLADVLGSRGIIPFRLATDGPGVIVTILMGYGPTFAALIVTGIIGGRRGIGKLLGRLLIWRVNLVWYAAALLGPALVFWLALTLYERLGGAPRALPPVSLPLLALNVVILFFVHGLINGEELGWRGFALPRLQTRRTALAASLVLGLFWALFHLPLFFTQGGGAGGGQSAVPMPAFLLQVLASSILVTWIFNNTRGSVLLACIFHASINTWSELFASAAPDALLFWLQTALICAAAAVVVVVFGASDLSRKAQRVQEPPAQVPVMQTAP